MPISEICTDDLADKLEADPGAVRLIDVREVDEYTAGHVPGAQLVVLATVPDNIDLFAGDGPAYVICKTGARSMRACQYLAERGVDAVNVAGGTRAWMMSGRDVVEGDQPS